MARPTHCCAIASAAICLAGPTAAAQPTRDSGVSLTIARPVSISKLTDMDFGTLAVTTGGTAQLNPANDAVATTGGVSPVGGLPRAARFRITATRLALVFIQVPSTPITITRVGGTETMSVTNWTMTGVPIRLLTGQAPTDIGVGATLLISNSQAEGTYAGTFEMTVDYF